LLLTRTDALLSQPETDKITSVHLPRCGRLSPRRVPESERGRAGSFGRERLEDIFTWGSLDFGVNMAIM
jgi:hypothetical protein